MELALRAADEELKQERQATKSRTERVSPFLSMRMSMGEGAQIEEERKVEDEVSNRPDVVVSAEPKKEEEAISNGKKRKFREISSSRMQDFFYISNYKKFLSIAKMRPEMILAPTLRERERMSMEIKIADTAATIGHSKVEAVVANLMEILPQGQGRRSYVQTILRLVLIDFNQV